MIKDTPAQQDLIKFKRSICVSGEDEDLGKVGPGYWRGFEARNRNKIVSKKERSMKWIGQHGRTTLTFIRCTMEL